MRLTIVNLVISGAMKGANRGETERSASILARKPGEMNPPYAGPRVAPNAIYKSAVKEARWSASIVVPANAGTHTPRRSLRASGQTPLQQLGPVVMIPAFEGTTTYTAILRCRTGAPAVRLSTASMMAL